MRNIFRALFCKQFKPEKINLLRCIGCNSLFVLFI